MLSGICITENADVSGVFAPDVEPAQVEVSALWKVAKFAQEEVQKDIPQRMRRRNVQLSQDSTVGVAKRRFGILRLLKPIRVGWRPLMTSQEVSRKVGSLSGIRRPRKT